jgi:hypothetical protein
MKSKLVKTKLITLGIPNNYNTMNYRVLWKHENGIYGGYKDFLNINEAKKYEQEIPNNLKLNI